MLESLCANATIREQPVGGPAIAGHAASSSPTGRCARSTASTSRPRRARSSACSGPTARARPPPCASSPRCSSPDAGSARVAGLDVVEDAAKLRAQIGLAGQYAAVDENLTGLENLVMVGRLYGERRARCREAGARAAGALRPRRGRRSRRRRATPAACGAGSTSPPRSSPGPPVLFLDEPTTGLDPRSRLELWETIEEPRRRGHHGAAHHPVPRRGRPAGRPDRGDRSRPRDRRRHRRRAQGPRRRRARRGARSRDGGDAAAAAAALAAMSDDAAAERRRHRPRDGQPASGAIMEAARRLDASRRRGRGHRGPPPDARRRVPRP